MRIPEKVNEKKDTFRYSATIKIKTDQEETNRVRGDSYIAQNLNQKH